MLVVFEINMLQKPDYYGHKFFDKKTCLITD